MYSSVASIGIIFIRIILMAVFSYIATDAVLASNVATPPLMYCLTAASCTVLAGYLFAPAEDYSINISALFVWSVVTALIAHGLFFYHTSVLIMEWRFYLLTAGVFIIACLLGCIHVMSDSFLKNRHISLCLVLTLVILFSSAPIWLGPLSYLYGQNELLINTIINASPLSFLATMADYDYLRSSWFYQNTPYGGLRYAYLTPTTGSIYYLLLGGLAVFISWYNGNNLFNSTAENTI